MRGSVYTFSVGAVNPAGVVTFAVTVARALPTGVTGLRNTALIGDDGVETNTVNNSSTITTPIVIGLTPDLQVQKDDGLTWVQPGSVVTYQIRVTNSGRVAAANVTLTETVPTYMAFNAAACQPTVWSCADGSLAGTLCTTTLASLADH